MCVMKWISRGIILISLTEITKASKTVPTEGWASVYLIILSAIIKALGPIFRLHFSINNSAVFTTIDVSA